MSTASPAPATPSSAVTITLPGRPVAATLDADALYRYLHGRPSDWAETHDNLAWVFHAKKSRPLPTRVTVVRDQRADPHGDFLKHGICAVADIENRHPLDVLADLLPPPAAPVAWPQLPSTHRERALTTVALAAEQARDWAGKLQRAGDPGRAQIFEGEAEALETMVALGKAAMRVPDAPCAAVAYVFRGDLVLSVTRAATGRHSAPGGKVEPGETPEQTVRRELEEETGLVALWTRQVYEAPGPSGRYVYAFLVEVADDAEPVAREDGTRVEWVTPVDLAASFAPEFHGPGLAAALPLRKAARR